MHEIECECGKVVRGQSMAQARNNLKNHRVSHGDYNRLQNRVGGPSGGGEGKAERIRKEAEELLRGNGRGRSSGLDCQNDRCRRFIHTSWNFTLA